MFIRLSYTMPESGVPRVAPHLKDTSKFGRLNINIHVERSLKSYKHVDVPSIDRPRRRLIRNSSGRAGQGILL
jgi:hypothetical protein